MFFKIVMTSLCRWVYKPYYWHMGSSKYIKYNIRRKIFNVYNSHVCYLDQYRLSQYLYASSQVQMAEIWYSFDLQLYTQILMCSSHQCFATDMQVFRLNTNHINKRTCKGYQYLHLFPENLSKKTFFYRMNYI